MNRRKLYNYLFILLYWIISINYLSTFSILMVEGFVQFADIPSDALTDQMALYMISPSQYIEGIFSGLFLGLLFIFINEISDRYHWDRLGFGRLILFKSIAYTVGFIFVFVLVFLIINSLGFYPDDFLITFEFSGTVKIVLSMVILFIVVQIIFLNYIIETNRKIGDFSVLSFLTGKYRSPVLEDRLFMFLDLRSSTTIAEHLRDVQYSQFLRDCFRDFNVVIKKFPSLDIYQYVGDEIVVTCKWKHAKDLIHMTQLYFQFIQRLKKRSGHYQSTFDQQPFFKAGIHGGQVSVTEIGILKRDIAFHGDVMNTTSRIQNLCNELDQGLLVSRHVVDKYKPSEAMNFLDMGAYQLKGKEETTEVVAIKEY